MTFQILCTSNKEGLVFRIKPSAPLDQTLCLDFYREGASSIETVLLQSQLQRMFDEQIEALRRVSYLRGWRAAKSKLKKATWFADYQKVLDWEEKEAGL